MLSSEDARRACEAYYPASRGRTTTVPFAVPAGPVTDADAELVKARAIADEYRLPERFFFMPNQFWKHKNHRTVVEALGILRERGVPAVVAASGNPSDPRDPAHFPALEARVRALGVDDAMRFLGMIPYPHLAALMRACTAVLNPSLFEGWSTTVEEARALGTPLVLSDLDVHREQMGGEASYFERSSPVSLADVLERFQPLDPVHRAQRVRDARRDSDERVRRFAAEFAGLVARCTRGGAR